MLRSEGDIQASQVIGQVAEATGTDDRPDGSGPGMWVARAESVTCAGRPSRTAGGAPAIAAGEASPELLDAVARMLRLLDHPADAAVLAPLVEREIFWRLLIGPSGDVIRQIGLPDSILGFWESGRSCRIAVRRRPGRGRRADRPAAAARGRRSSVAGMG